MKNDKRKTICAICIVLIAAIMTLFMVQMGYMGRCPCLFFDERGLPTLISAICGVVFGVLLFVLGKNLNVKKAYVGKLCRVIGILEMISAVLLYLMTLIINSQVH